MPVPSAGAKAASASPDGAAAAAGTGTSPIDIDPRKEVNKVRSSLTVGPKKDRRYGRAGGKLTRGTRHAEGPEHLLTALRRRFIFACQSQ